MKIIDSHVHIGQLREWDFPGDLLIESMDKYGIGFGLVSNVSGGEFVGDQEHYAGGNQIEVNDVIKTFVMTHPDRFRGLFWIRPRLEGFSPEIEGYLQENQQFFCGLKVHSSQSKLPFTPEYHRDYLTLCARLKLPIAVHTEIDGYANPAFVYETAKAFPDVNFIMVHMGMWTDHLESIGYVRELPNLYADTTFVDTESVMRAVKECGSAKILFGSDAPALGVDIYERYQEVLARFEEDLSSTDRENILFRNAERLFKL